MANFMKAPTASSRTNIDQWVLRVAGTMVIASVILSQLYSPLWLALTAFVGLNMLQASVTGFCPLAILLRRAGIPAGPAFAGVDLHQDKLDAEH